MSNKPVTLCKWCVASGLTYPIIQLRPGGVLHKLTRVYKERALKTPITNCGYKLKSSSALAIEQEYGVQGWA